jgi:hypothetical protein
MDPETGPRPQSNALTNLDYFQIRAARKKRLTHISHGPGKEPGTEIQRTADLLEAMQTDRRIFAISAGLFVASCDGPHEDAGERIDARRGATGGESSIVAGPAERRGERLDREESRSNAARETAATRGRDR